MNHRAGGGLFDPVVARDVHDWNTRALTVADLDGDGLTDLVIADGLASIRYQDPAGHFRPPIWLRQ